LIDRLLAVLNARFGSAPALEPAHLPNGTRGVEALAEMANRRVVRRYADKPLDPALLETLCAVALSAPSKSDLQQTDIVVVTDKAQRTTDRATSKLSDSDLTLVTSDQVTAGLVVRDQRGQRIGTVSSVSGDTATVVSGKRSYSVPLSSLYTSTTGKANTLISSVPRAQLTGKVNAKANAKSAVSSGN